MAIFVHNTPSNAIGQAPPPGPDTFIQTLNQVRRDRENQANRTRDQDINERRYQDYNRFRREELAERKGVEDRLFGERKDALIGQEEDDINRAEFGHRQLRQGMKLHESDYAVYTQNINRHTADLASMGLNEAQIRSFIDGTATPPDTIRDKVATLKRAVGLRQGVVTKANQDVDQYNREFGLGVVLGINETSGKMALSAPYIPNRRLSKPPAQPGQPSGQQGQQYFQSSPDGPMGNTDPMDTELPGSGSGESDPMSLQLPQAAQSPQAQQNAAFFPSAGRAAAGLGGSVISGIGEYGRNAGLAAKGFFTPAYRALFSRQPGQDIVTLPEYEATKERIGSLVPKVYREPPSFFENWGWAGY